MIPVSLGDLGEELLAVPLKKIGLGGVGILSKSWGAQTFKQWSIMRTLSNRFHEPQQICFGSSRKFWDSV